MYVNSKFNQSLTPSSLFSLTLGSIKNLMVCAIMLVLSTFASVVFADYTVSGTETYDSSKMTGVITLSNGSILDLAGLTIDGSRSIVIEQGSTATLRVNTQNTVGYVKVPVTLNGTMCVTTAGSTYINPGTCLSISGNISGSGKIQLKTGRLDLSGTNTYTGGLTCPSTAWVSHLYLSGDQSGATGGYTLGASAWSDSIGFRMYSGSSATGSLTIRQCTSYDFGDFMQQNSTYTINDPTQGVTLQNEGWGCSSTPSAFKMAGTFINKGTLTLTNRSCITIQNPGTWTQSGKFTISENANGCQSGITIDNGGTFTYDGSNAIAMALPSNNSGAIIFNINGTFSTTAGFDVTSTSVSGAGRANITLGSTGTIKAGGNIANFLVAGTNEATSPHLIINGGTFDTNGYDVTINTNNIPEMLSGAGTLTKSGAGTLTLSGKNSLTGAVSVKAGTLTMSGASTYNGGTSVTGGRLELGIATTGSYGAITSSAVGTGGLNINGGTVGMKSDQTNITLYNDTTIGTNDATIDLAPNQNLTLTFSSNSDGVLTLQGGGNLVMYNVKNDYYNPVKIGGLCINGGKIQLTAKTPVSGYYVLTNSTVLEFGENGGELNNIRTNLYFTNAFTITTTKLNEGKSNLISGTLYSTWGGGLNNNGRNLTVDTVDGGDLTISTRISGTGALNKQGDGTLILSNVNTYTGTTTISDGTIQLTGNGKLGTNKTTISSGAMLELNVADGQTKNWGDFISNTVSGDGTIVKSGKGTLKAETTVGGQISTDKFAVASGRLDFQGNYLGSVTVQRDSIFSPGNTVGELTIVDDGSSNSITFNAGSTLLIEQDATGMDELILEHGSTLTLDDGAIIELSMGLAQPGASYPIITSVDAFEGEQKEVSYWNSFLSPSSDYFWNLSVVGGNQVWAQIDAGAVPEPSTWALLILGFAGLMKVASCELRVARKRGRR